MTFRKHTEKRLLLLQLRFDYDTKTIRLIRLRIARVVVVSQSNRNCDIGFRQFLLSLYHNCDSATIRLRRKFDIFISCSRRIASNGRRRARYVVVVSYSYRSQIAIIITALSSRQSSLNKIGLHLQFPFPDYQIDP